MKIFHRRIKTLCIALAVFGFLYDPISASAIEFGRPELNGSVEHISSSDVDETKPQAEVSVTSTIVGTALPVNLTENSDLAVNFSGGVFHFDWSNTARLKFSNGQKPWGDLFSADFGLTYSYKWNKKWTSFIGSGVAAGWEKDTDDIFSYSGFLGSSYRWGQKLNWKASLGLGFGHGPYGTAIGPFASISWNEDQRKLFQSGWSFYLKFPLDVEIAYVFNERWAIHYNWRDSGAIFRLADDNDVSPEGLLAASFSKAGLTVDFRPIETLTLSLGFNHYFHKKLDIQDDDGNSLQTIKIDDSFGGRFSVSWSF